MLHDKRILLIVSGGIAVYKALDLVRRLRERGASVRAVMTPAAQRFVTPLAFGAITGNQVFIELFDRAAEHDVGHIRLLREADLVLVAPATADLMAKMVHGLADDLATATLLASKTPILIAPAMNSVMWANPATQRNVAQLRADGIAFIGPMSGEMAESGEAGVGRMAEPLDIAAAVQAHFETSPAPGVARPLAGRRVVVTSGPTHEPIDPVRYIANRSSGKQGHAIAAAAAAAGAEVVLVSGPVTVPDPAGVEVVHVETAREMQAAVDAALPADIAVLAAAVADWRAKGTAAQKIKKDGSGRPPMLEFAENPDILAGIGHRTKDRPALVVGFAAETADLLANAQAKLAHKGADWIVANDVSLPSTGEGIMGGNTNEIRLVFHDGVEEWPRLDKRQVAERLVARIAAYFEPEDE
ncbi:bifunctional phosphopantothenoylcysteine decarboxylase/phosphopantothenate--cysteine ligase CoaBC [Breoghania sp.]|uniref:bifunctional phosphopantothenoylcysteine decarboxylase/phosphopantothenate--cysteine ligase CoaBC n=1 Tax=Breoghania sp. TaxID=2065378 RepID=UPI002620238B|nr:bifunctional phosphopantothenoylcysteine decarboxylase/phosphopantothenate--cysteine ligase CoaBC [Breoghania sp.]MDJ0930393.1 bifunctional phosphopantothenoylcysteine decarboxylase/phosphopantothenate--cysteine ligase CoaBC [Breoghania sp.]